MIILIRALVKIHLMSKRHEKVLTNEGGEVALFASYTAAMLTQRSYVIAIIFWRESHWENNFSAWIDPVPRLHGTFHPNERVISFWAKVLTR
jgi:hypothetical protein